MNIQSTLLNWYEHNKRDLPWRHSIDPYHIWVSEIILQQTRVAQGLNYYYKFISEFPDIKTLASAKEDEVLRTWQGLGYYTRARNMHAAAKIILQRFNGKFPENYSDILSLPGIGKYTAAAIASLVFNYPAPAIDGNVIRLISRLYAIGGSKNSPETQRKILSHANSMMNIENPGQHNQAMIELGALICTPQNPDCPICPIKASCHSFLSNTVNDFPEKYKKKISRSRYFYYYIMGKDDKLIITKRKQKDIWNSLFEFPLFEAQGPLDNTEILAPLRSQWLLEEPDFVIKGISPCIKHILSHQLIHAWFINIEINIIPENPDWILIHKNDIHEYAFPVLISNFLSSR
jgi:A/G-specific adenine glycosylase